MADNNYSHAQDVFEYICDFLDRRNWKYSVVPDKNIIRFGISGDDLPMDFNILVDEERQLIRVLSKIPVSVPKEKVMEMAVAVCVVSDMITDGSFDFDMTTGDLYFRLTATILETDVSDKLIGYLIDYSTYVVETYNDKIFGLAKGMINVNTFIDERLKLLEE